MSKKPAQQDIDLNIYNAVSQSQDALFERFDNLHKRGITDDDVILTLRKGGYRDLAEGYIEWSGALDPERTEDNTTMNPVVPDPGDAPSYASLPERCLSWISGRGRCAGYVGHSGDHFPEAQQ